MFRPLARAALCVFALVSLWSLILGGTESAYVATATTATNTFTAAADSVAPAVSAAAIGRASGYATGFIKQSATYYVYAAVADTGNPASGVASVTANVQSITSGATAVVLSAGTYNAAGTAYNYRSAALTASSSLPAGSNPYTVTAGDQAGNSGVQSFSATIDNTAPSAVDVQTTNVSGGTVGHLDTGDTLTLTDSEAIDPYSILAGWTGATTNVQIMLADGGKGAPDIVSVLNTAATPAQIPIGTITLGSNAYMNPGDGKTTLFGAVGTATPSTMTRNGAVITLVLGSASGPSLTSTAAGAMIWTPNTAATDLAGNAASATPVTQSGPVHVNF